MDIFGLLIKPILSQTLIIQILHFDVFLKLTSTKEYASTMAITFQYSFWCLWITLKTLILQLMNKLMLLMIKLRKSMQKNSRMVSTKPLIRVLTRIFQNVSTDSNSGEASWCCLRGDRLCLPLLENPKSLRKNILFDFLKAHNKFGKVTKLGTPDSCFRLKNCGHNQPPNIRVKKWVCVICGYFCGSGSLILT